MEQLQGLLWDRNDGHAAPRVSLGHIQKYPCTRWNVEWQNGHGTPWYSLGKFEKSQPSSSAGRPSGNGHTNPDSWGYPRPLRATGSSHANSCGHSVLPWPWNWAQEEQAWLQSCPASLLAVPPSTQPALRPASNARTEQDKKCLRRHWSGTKLQRQHDERGGEAAEKRTEIIWKTVPYSRYCQHGGGTLTRAFKYSKNRRTFWNNNPCLFLFCAFNKTLT